MRVLSIDPGAERLGWAVLQKPVASDVSSTPPMLVACGLGKVEQGRLKFQEYRLKLIDYWADNSETLLSYEPDIVVSEIVPPAGGGAFASNGIQSQLAVAAVTTIQAMARYRDFEITQLAANTVKVRIGGSTKATKQQVRNSVITIMPELERFRKEWVKMFDVSDALAVGLAHLGYNRKHVKENH